MLFYCKITESEGIDKSKGVDVVREGGVFSYKQYDICLFYFFKNRNFNYEPYVCNEFHGASLHARSIAHLKIVAIKKGTYRNFSNILYNEITRLLETSDLKEKIGYL